MYSKARVVCIAGIGLIGGSMALALKRSGYATEVLGVDDNSDNARRALDLGLVDRLCTLEGGVSAADLTVLCTPVGVICNLLPVVLDIIDVKAGSGLECGFVADVGSTKVSIVKSVEGHPRRGHYVAAHPIAGTENSGPDAAVQGLFKGKNAILCDTRHSRREAVKMVCGMFSRLEMDVSEMDSLSHDMHVAYVSHLSHITSFALALSVLEKEKSGEDILTLAAGGFDSTVRLAKSHSATWSPILMHNKAFVLEAIDSYISKMELFKEAIGCGDEKMLVKLMDDANKIRKVLDK